MNDNTNITIEVPKGNLTTMSSGTVAKITMFLEASDMEQVKVALNKGKRLIETRLNRTKNSFKGMHTETELNNVNSALTKAENAKPKVLYPVELLTCEVETLIYSLEHMKNCNSKAIKCLIDELNRSLYD